MGRKLTLALDLGSYELKGIVFEIVEYKNTIHVLAAKKEKTLGVEEGRIKNPNLLKKQVGKVLDSLIEEVGDYVDEVYLNIPPVNTLQNNIVKQMIVADSTGSAIIDNSHVSELTEKLIDEIKRKSENKELTLIDFMINEYNISPSPKSKYEIVDNPIGMDAYALGMDMFFILAKSYVISTLQTIFEGLEVVLDKITVPYVPGGLKAVPYTARKNGALYIDFGATFTDAVVFKNNSIVHSYSLPLGGDAVTSDIVRAFGKNLDDRNFALAEKMKKKYSNLIIEAEDSQKNIFFEPDLLSDLFLTLEQVKLVMRERVKEIFSLIKEEIEQNQALTARGVTFSQVVLSGGSSKFEGIDEVAREVFNLPVVVATPFIDSGVDFEEIDSPEFVPVYGLAEYFAADIRKPELNSGIFNKMMGKLKTIFNRKKRG